MCAIIGCSAPEGVAIDEKDVKILFLAAETRGGHACGYSNGKKIVKKAMTSYDFVHKIMCNDKWKDNFTIDGEFGTFIGHTRYATIGDRKNDNNAHPFLKENLIGVHNGSIYNHDDLKDLVNTDSVVDSSIMYDLIDRFGIKKSLPLLNGVLALCYFDRRNGDIKVFRQNRPLYYGYKMVRQKDGSEAKVMFWGSYRAYLNGIGCDKVKEFKENVLYTIRGGKIAQGRQVKKVQRPTPPNEVEKNDVKMLSKTKCLDIWNEKVDEIKALDIDDVESLIEEKQEEIKVKKQQEKSQAVVSGNEETNACGKTTKSGGKRTATKAIVIYEQTALSEIPMHAIGVVSKYLGALFYWFDEDNPGLVRVCASEMEVTEAFDLITKDGQAKLAKCYGGDDSDIVQEIMHYFEEYIEPTYEMRMKLEEEHANNQTKCKC